MADNKLDVHLVTPEREVWAGEADMVIARTTEGEIGILPGHAPLLGKLKISALAIKTGGEKTWAAVDGGFIHVKDDRVDVLGEGAELEGEIDVESARRRAQEAEQRLGEGIEDEEEQKRELERARVRVDLGG
ncbi:MAG TPA: F0F1 ATP synthase subunit epsilon [Actinomycetota bacterium]|nr:F0F1 ATP synthase subunit epsilon [Actinomycetota bacterium]